MQTLLNISISRGTLEEAIEHLEWVVERIKNYPQPDAYGEWKYTYTWPVEKDVYEPTIYDAYADYADDDPSCQ